MRGEPMAQRANLVRPNQRAREDRVQRVLIGEVEGILGRSFADHRPADVDVGLSLLQVAEEAQPEILRNHEEATVHVRLASELAEAEEVAPPRVVPVVEGVGERE